MFMLSLGVANIDETLPGAAYAFLSGLNAAVVGVIALATTELSKKAITDDVTRLIVFGTASTGMLYNAIWYFPTLMALSGLTTLVYDLGLVHRLFRPLSSKRAPSPDILPAPDTRQNTPELENGVVDAEADTPTCQTTPLIPDITTPLLYRPGPTPSQPRIPISPRTGLILILSFLTFFLLVLTLPPLFFPTPSILLTLFTNLLISGTVIFGGGPVVIPLLREVSPIYTPFHMVPPRRTRYLTSHHAVNCNTRLRLPARLPHWPRNNPVPPRTKLQHRRVPGESHGLQRGISPPSGGGASVGGDFSAGDGACAWDVGGLEGVERDQGGEGGAEGG